MPQIHDQTRDQPADSPVRSIPTDVPAHKPNPGMALCLSGGGYRAMVFHIGAIWRLSETGVLPSLQRISSVSGGSITAGMLALKWKRLAARRRRTAPHSCASS
jgi:NTE family protein